MSYMTVLKDKRVTTRTSHGCIWCYEAIDIGSNVRYRVTVSEEERGTIWPEWWHDECWSAMVQSDANSLEDGWMPGDYAKGQVAE